MSWHFALLKKAGFGIWLLFCNFMTCCRIVWSRVKTVGCFSTCCGDPNPHCPDAGRLHLTEGPGTELTRCPSWGGKHLGHIYLSGQVACRQLKICMRDDIYMNISHTYFSSGRFPNLEIWSLIRAFTVNSPVHKKVSVWIPLVLYSALCESQERVNFGYYTFLSSNIFNYPVSF